MFPIIGNRLVYLQEGDNPIEHTSNVIEYRLSPQVKEKRKGSNDINI
jgi:hypothetical protein